MPTAAFTLSAFGDEIADDLDEQLDLLQDLRIPYLELRAAWGKNVLRMDAADAAAVRATCERHGIGVSCIGSPVGKSSIAEPIATEKANLTRLFGLADTVGTRRLRIFSFYPPSGAESFDGFLDEAASRLAQLAALAQTHGFLLLLENEKAIVGDAPERCAALLKAVDSPALRFVWDPANFVQVGVERPTDRGWPLLAEFLAHVQIKDAVSGGGVRAAGEGDGQVGELLDRLRDSGYGGFLGLEPHLAMAGPSSGFSGREGMRQATESLRRLMAARGCAEVATAR